MKKIYLLFLVIISMFMMSCGGRFFNPRYYYNKSISSIVTEEPEGGDIDLGDENLSPEEDPFDPNYQGDGYYGWNDESYVFDGSVIDKWFMKVNFGSGNVPDYRFFIPTDGRVWLQGDAAKNEFSFDASPDENKVTSPIIISISDMVVYKYVRKNPLLDANGSYNSSTRLERFIFMRINGSAAGTPMNNYLIAVDKYSKFIFAYAKITSTGSTFGQKYPTAFDAIEKYADKRKFYEYDPIGFVHEDGSVTLYDEYKNEMASGATDYVPSVHKTSDGKVRELATRDNPGRSPYYVEDTTPKKYINVVFSGTIKNIDSQSANRVYSTLGGWFGLEYGEVKDKFNYGNFLYNIGMSIYGASDDIISYTTVASKTGSKVKDSIQVNLSETKDLINELQSPIEIEYKESDDMYMNIGINVTKYDERYLDPDITGYQLFLPYSYSEDNKIYIKLKYNKDTKTFNYDSAVDGYGNRLRMIDSNISLSLNNGQGSISLELDGQDGDYNAAPEGGATGLNNKIELNLKFTINEVIK
ncbi:hypothetical protein R4K54_08435 [Brachyspira murdochii]|uniref:hypothetical protein n=1 Tax=Brachyspira murdochii TaxID=84378 RepID=UPI00300688FD